MIEDTLPIYLRKRYWVVFLAFLGFVNLYTMRVNLSVAIVAMTGNHTVVLADGSSAVERDFDWSSKERGFALGAFFYGYITTMFIGGYIASKFGGKRIFGLGILGTSVMTLLTPILSYQGVYYLIAVRVSIGILSGLSYPSINALYAKWAPPMERSRISSCGISVCFFGTVVAMLVSGWLAANFSWESIFYVFGTAGIVWSVAWLILVKESPEEDSQMKECEKVYIRNSLKRQGQVNVVKPPWKEILTSMPVSAVAVAHFSYLWGYYTLLTQLPIYMNEILHFDLQQTGFVSALPFLVLSIMLFFTGMLADWLQIKDYMSTTQVRKQFTNLSFFGQMVFLILAAFFVDTTLIIVCITLSVGLGAFSISGYYVSPLDMAPQFSSIIIGICNTFATLTGLISPVLTGYIVGTPTDEEYRIVFFIASAIYIVGMVYFQLFGSGKVQPWAVRSVQESKRNSVGKEPSL